MERVTFESDGETLVGDLYLPSRPATGRFPLLVLPHGMNSCRVEWYDFPQKLADAGFAVFPFDFRGHGESTGERGYQTAPNAAADLAAAFKALQDHVRVDPDRAALVGHSLGASLALCAAADLPIQAFVAMAPPNRLSDEVSLFEYLGYTVAAAVNLPVRLLHRPGFRIPRIVHYADLYADPAAIQRARRDQFLQKTIPVKNYVPLLIDLDPEACARRVTLPTLVLVAEWDVVVGKWNSRKVYNALAGPKDFVEIPRSGHSMMGDQNSDLVATKVITFLTEHLRSGAR